MIDSRIESLLRELDRQGVTGVCTRCPVCERERKFSVNFRDGLALYCCHRVSCGVRGVYAIAGNGERRQAPAFTPRPLTDEYRLPLPGEYWTQYIAHRIKPGANPADFALENGFRVLADKPTTAVWLISNLDRYALGHVTRTQDKRIQSWFISDAPRYGYWHHLQPFDEIHPVLIVEDPMSAALWPGPAIALLGTNLSREVAAEIARRLPLQRFYVALDPDALSATFPVVSRLRSYGLAALPLAIPRDIKDMPYHERVALYESLT